MTSQKIPQWSVPLNMKFLFNVRTHDVGGRRRMTVRETQESAGVESCAKKVLEEVRTDSIYEEKWIGNVLT